MATRHLYLIRHGQYYLNRAGPPKAGHLTPLGRRQARAAGRALKYLTVDCIHASDLTRALETTAAVQGNFAKVEVKKSRLLRECYPCIDFKLLIDKRLIGNAAPESLRARLWRESKYREKLAKKFAALHGKEPVSSDAIDRAIKKLFRPTRGRDRHELVICHGNVIRYMACRAIGVLPEAWTNMGTFHCGVSRVRIEQNGAVTLDSYNETGHLTPAMHTVL